MSDPRTAYASRRPPLRVWPGVVAVTLLWLVWHLGPLLVSGTTGGMIGAFGALAGGVLVLVWWAFLSRAPRLERWGGALLLVGALVAVRPVLHESIARGGMGFLFPMYGLSFASLALVVWAAVARRLPYRPRRWSMVATILLAAAGWTLLRNDGVSAEGAHFAWRWAATAEDRLLAAEGESAMASSPSPAMEGVAAWPGFRGPRRDGVVRGVRIETDWAGSPPLELWRRAVGPGWSSFAVHGDRLYTLEQRGEDEVVSCYDAGTGEPVWRHHDAARFWEPEGGPGPRGTPAVADGRVYSFGATGIVNALDAGDGSLVWTRDATDDSGREAPYWGLASSPLVTDGLVVVAVSGRLVAYDPATGEPVWLGPDGGVSYSSPHRLTIGGVDQIVLSSGAGATAVAPADGRVLWQHEWPGFSIVQPARTGDGDLLFGADGVGTVRVAVHHGDDGWRTEERWTSNRLKSNFNDFVVHEGHAYGFDGNILASIDVADGRRNWKGGRYGQGQLVLLAEQDLLLVVTEHGDLALVAASPDGFTELARVPALEGKTWNHPVLVGDRLVLRNGQEMAAFRLELRWPE